MGEHLLELYVLGDAPDLLKLGDALLGLLKRLLVMPHRQLARIRKNALLRSFRVLRRSLLRCCLSSRSRGSSPNVRSTVVIGLMVWSSRRRCECSSRSRSSTGRPL